jgi:membrane fusion protein (multidrug efflux system)
MAGLAALLLASCAGGEDKGKQKRPVPEVGFVVAEASSVPEAVELAGRIAAFEMSEVRPQVTGLIKRRLFTEGAVVRAGQTLYEIDTRLFRAASNEARANLASALASAEATRLRAERLKPLAEAQAVSQQDYTDAAAAARQAAAAVQQARARLQTADVNLSFTRVRDLPACLGQCARHQLRQPLVVLHQQDAGSVHGRSCLYLRVLPMPVPGLSRPSSGTSRPA